MDYKKCYLELVENIKEEHHLAYEAVKRATEKEGPNEERDQNFLRGVTFMTLDLLKLVNDQKKS